MKNEKFNQLIIDTYNKAKSGGDFIGIVYGPISKDSFSKIIDIEKYVEHSPAEMLYLNSKLNNIEVDIYEYDFVDYSIEDETNEINIKLRNKEVTMKFNDNQLMQNSIKTEENEMEL